MLDIHKALKTLEEIENKSADLYAWLSGVFASDEKASLLFARLHLGKLSHANLLQYQSRIILKNPRAFRGAVSVDSDHARAITESIERFRNTTPSLSVAVRTALIFGHAVEQIYQDQTFRDSLDGLGPFVAQLRKGSQDHGAALKHLAADRGLPDALPAFISAVPNPTPPVPA